MKTGRDYRIAINARVQLQLSKAETVQRWKKERGRDTIDSLGGSALDGNTLQVEWVWCMRHRQTSYPSSSPRRDTRTNAHLALKHVKHDPSKGPDDLGREREAFWRSGGSITTDPSMTCEPHKASET